ncbi:MAG: hypothetical protein IT371_30375 [Deltaproteobacteria bacterium]|nr:hypothetical protein [Deltaproteobacteria bacterium]
MKSKKKPTWAVALARTASAQQDYALAMAAISQHENYDGEFAAVAAALDEEHAPAQADDYAEETYARVAAAGASPALRARVAVLLLKGRDVP